MSDDVTMTAAEVEELLAALRLELLTPGATVEWRQDAGDVVRENWNTGLMEHAPNGTRTFTVTIYVNGGARRTRGEPIR